VEQCKGCLITLAKSLKESNTGGRQERSGPSPGIRRQGRGARTGNKEPVSKESMRRQNNEGRREEEGKRDLHTG